MKSGVRHEDHWHHPKKNQFLLFHRSYNRVLFSYLPECMYGQMNLKWVNEMKCENYCHLFLRESSESHWVFFHSSLGHSDQQHCETVLCHSISKTMSCYRYSISGKFTPAALFQCNFRWPVTVAKSNFD